MRYGYWLFKFSLADVLRKGQKRAREIEDQLQLRGEVEKRIFWRI